jgi:TolA-binding protein
VLHNAAKTPWIWGVGVGIVAIAAIAAGLGAYFGNRGGAPAPVEQTAAAPTAPAAAPTPAPVPEAAAQNPAPPPAAPVTAKPAVPATQAAAGTATKVAGGANASGSKTGLKPLPSTALAVPAAASRETQAAQLLEVAKAKLANNLNEQALSDLRQIIIDFPGSRTAAEAAFLAAEIHEKSGRMDDAMAAYVEFESRFGNDRRAADAKLRRSQILGRQQRNPKSTGDGVQLLNDVVRDFPSTPQAQAALQSKLRIETERRDLRSVDPVSKQEGPAVITTLRTIIEQFPDSPEAMAARNRLAMTFTQLNRHAEAAEVMEDLGARGNTPPDFYFRLGEIYERRLNNPVKAKEAFAKVPVGSPRYSDAQKKLNRK